MCNGQTYIYMNLIRTSSSTTPDEDSHPPPLHSLSHLLIETTFTVHRSWIVYHQITINACQSPRFYSLPTPPPPLPTRWPLKSPDSRVALSTDLYCSIAPAWARTHSTHTHTKQRTNCSDRKSWFFLHASVRRRVHKPEPQMEKLSCAAVCSEFHSGCGTGAVERKINKNVLSGRHWTGNNNNNIGSGRTKETRNVRTRWHPNKPPNGIQCCVRQHEAMIASAKTRFLRHGNSRNVEWARAMGQI